MSDVQPNNSAQTANKVKTDQPQPTSDSVTTYHAESSVDAVTTFNTAPSDDQATTFGNIPQMPESRNDTDTSFAAKKAAPTSSFSAVDTPARHFYRVGTLVLHDQYELVQALTGGAQALAFRGRRVLDNKAVFIKIQPNDVAGASHFAKQIAVREKMISLHHPNLLPCLAWDLDRESLCEVYPFVEGVELKDWLMTVSRPLPDAVVETFVRQIAEAIHGLHTQTSLAHRDLKPSNIMVLSQNGELHFTIVDYGTVSHIDSGGETSVAGTRDYSPPEFYRRKINNNELRSWDWWSFGRILQTVLDGLHPFDRYLSNQANNAFRETFVDHIMLEDAIQKYKMRAGMVEMFDKKPELAHWLPLLRGLLTSNKQSRWGYSQIHDFLEGKSTPDGYAQSIEIDAYPYDNEYWNIAELAKKWISEGAKQEDIWEKARQQVYGGELVQYLEQTLRDELLLRNFRQCRKVNNPDLGTGLALYLLASSTGSVFPEQIQPAVRDKVINREYALVVAQDNTEAAEKLLSELMSPGFREILSEVAPQSTASLIELSRDMEELIKNAAQYRKSERKDLSSRYCRLVRLLAAPKNQVSMEIETKARQHYHHTTVEKVQQLYSTPDLSELYPLDLKMLSLLLDEPDTAGFVTNKYEAERLSREAKQYCQADAYWQMANFFSWKWALLNGKKGAVFRLWFIIALFVLFGSALHYSSTAGQLFEFNYLFLLLGAITFAGIFTAVRSFLARALLGELTLSEVKLRGDASEITMPPLTGDKASDPNTLRERARTLAPKHASTSENAPDDFGKLLKERNAQIRRISNIKVDDFVVGRVSFKKPLSVVVLQVMLVIVLLAGGSFYAPWLGQLVPTVNSSLLTSEKK